MEDRKGQRNLLSHFNINDTGVTVFQSKILKSEEWNFHTLRIFTLENDREVMTRSRGDSQTITTP